MNDEMEMLRERLREAEETLEAIRSGEVDAVVVSGADGAPKIYALETADQTYRVIVEEMQEGALTLSLDGEVLYCNRRLAELLAEDGSRIVGRALATFIHPKDRLALARAASSNGKSEFSISTGDGDFFQAHFSFATLKDADGGPDIVCCVVTDLTEQNSTNAALHAANEKLLSESQERERTEKLLRQSQKMEVVGQLTGGVAHDFNNLLMAISGGLDMLERSPDPARFERLKSGMRQAVDRGAALTRQLLTFSRTKAINTDVVDLKLQIEGMLELLDRSLRGDIQVQTMFPEGLWPVRIDVGEFELVVLNLCVNARDAMPDGGTITLSARNQARGSDTNPPLDFAVLMITDSGTGMSPEVIAHAFEPFFTTKDIGKGSGLGLAQAYGFAKSSGGKVEIESEVGRGTTISLFLPKSADVIHGSDEHAEPDATETVSSEGRVVAHVLLVEDDQDVAAFTIEMLEEIGCEVTRVAGAQAALGALSNGRRIDLVFSDIMMPGGMNGIQLADEIARRYPGMPILLTSGHAAPYLSDANRIGAHVLAKPYTIRELSSAIAFGLTGVAIKEQ